MNNGVHAKRTVLGRCRLVQRQLIQRRRLPLAVAIAVCLVVVVSGFVWPQRSGAAPAPVPTVVLEPSSGLAGILVSISATNFPRITDESTATITLDIKGQPVTVGQRHMEICATSPVLSVGFGHLCNGTDVTFVVPAAAAPGPHAVAASVSNMPVAGGVISAQATFTVIAADTPTGTPTDTPTNTPTNTPTDTSTNTPTNTPTSTPTDTPTRTPTGAPASTATTTPALTTGALPTNTPSSTSSSTPSNTVAPPTAGAQASAPEPRAHIVAVPALTNPGGLLTVTGSGFGPGEAVRVSFDGFAGPTVMATSDGSLPPTGLAVPSSAAAGGHTVFALGLSTQRRAEAPVTVLSVRPTLRLDRATAHIGDRMCASGASFLADEPVTLAVDSVAVAETTASHTGTFTTCFAVPGTIVDGANDVTALGARSRMPAVAPFIGLVSPPSTFYFVGASTAGGEDTELAVLNPQPAAATLTLRFYLPSGGSFVRTAMAPAHTRATLRLSRYVRGITGFGLRVQADQVVAAQMIVRRGRLNPYTSLGSGLLTTRWYLAEGYTGLTFHETLYVLNPNTAATTVSVRLLPFNDRGARTIHFTVPAQQTYRLNVNQLYHRASLAALVTSTLPTSVERVLTFGDGGYGATGNAGTPLAATTWLFAEGSGAGKLQTFLTVLNPGRQAAIVAAVLNDPQGHVLGERTIVVQGLHRGNIRLNDTTHAGAIATTLTSSVPVVVERPFYLDNPNRGRTGATLVYGRNGPSTRWSFPAGDTTRGAREDLLLLNPAAQAVAVRAVFYLASGRMVTQPFTVPAGARFTLRVNAVPGLNGTLHGLQLTAPNTRSVVAEQSIYNSDGTTIYGSAGLAQ